MTYKKYLVAAALSTLTKGATKMKATNVRFNVRFDVYQLEHLKMQAKMRGIQAADYVREADRKRDARGAFFKLF